MGNNTIQYGSHALELTREEFDDDKQKNFFIKKCVQIVRQTPEYREWVAYVKDMLGYNTCLITGEKALEVSVEIHHHPLTLFDVVSVVLDTYLAAKSKFTSMNIINDVLTLHYNDKIGFIPLCTTWHEKYHNGYAVIPPKFIHGEWDYVLKTQGYAQTVEMIERASSLMSDSNNQYDVSANNWQNVMGGVVAANA